jgi:HSP20 family protein
MFYDVFGPSWNLHSDFERIIDEMTSFGGGRSRRADGAALNVWANDESVAVTASVPGIDPASIDLSIVGDTLTVSGKREAAQQKDATWLRRERGAVSFSRTIQLPFSVDPARTEARVKDGVLTIALRRTEADKPRRIAVTAA